MRLAALLERLRRPAAVSEQTSNETLNGDSVDALGTPPAISGEGNMAAMVDMDSVRQELDAIQEMIGSDRVEIPCRALLSRLPEGLRGPDWKADGCPDSTFSVDSRELLEKLSTGQVSIPLGDVIGQLPAGWVACSGDEVVDLSLADVVSALPEELLEVQAEPSDFTVDVGGMRDYFQPAVSPEELFADDVTPAEEPVSPVVAETEPIEAVAPVVEVVPEAAVEEPVDTTNDSTLDWSGVEVSLESAPRGVDINTASCDELQVLPGVGPVRARAIVEYRSANGPFASIFDLGQVPDIGNSRFQQMTGLSLRSRRRRQEKLNELLDVSKDKALSINDIAEGMLSMLGAEAVLLVNVDGVVLSNSGNWESGADRYGALGLQIVRRLGSYTQRLGGEGGDCMILPVCQPPMMVASADTVVVVAALNRTSLSGKALGKVRTLVEEVAWLMGPRAVVRNIA